LPREFIPNQQIKHKTSFATRSHACCSDRPRRSATQQRRETRSYAYLFNTG